jgi:hypothetical protein
MVNVPVVMGIISISTALAGLGFAFAERRALKNARLQAEEARKAAEEALRAAQQAALALSKTGTDSSYSEISQGETYHLAGMGR